MNKTDVKCCKCDKTFVQERGKGALPINTSHMCKDCRDAANPIIRKPTMAWTEPVPKSKDIKTKKAEK
jgi:hypothetical protein